MIDIYPRFKAAAIQIAPVFLDRDATIEKMTKYVENARKMGADIAIFGESFIPAFPIWNLIYPPVDQHEMRRKLYDNAIDLKSPYFEKLSRIAKENDIYLSVGITEKSKESPGTMWNSNLMFNREGKLLLNHRKIVPTWAEMLTWARGDGSTLSVVDTEIGRIGVLICGENTNPLARFSLLAQGEEMHIATYPPAWPFSRQVKNQYDLSEAIKIRTTAHSFEGKVFTIAASVALDKYTIDILEDGFKGSKEILESVQHPVSLAIDPSGKVIAGPLIGDEGILIVDVDLSKIIEQKEIHDILGYYNRFDIFKLELNKKPQRPLWIDE